MTHRGCMRIVQLHFFTLAGQALQRRAACRRPWPLPAVIHSPEPHRLGARPGRPVCHCVQPCANSQRRRQCHGRLHQAYRRLATAGLRRWPTPGPHPPPPCGKYAAAPSKAAIRDTGRCLNGALVDRLPCLGAPHQVSATYRAPMAANVSNTMSASALDFGLVRPARSVRTAPCPTKALTNPVSLIGRPDMQPMR